MIFLKSQFRLVECVKRCKFRQGNTKFIDYISKDILSAYLCCMCGGRSQESEVTLIVTQIEFLSLILWDLSVYMCIFICQMICLKKKGLSFFSLVFKGLVCLFLLLVLR